MQLFDIQVFLIAVEGAVIAMAGVVAVAAAVATVTTKKLYGIFSKGDPKDTTLQQSIKEWRAAVDQRSANLVELKDKELDLMAQEIQQDRSWLKAKDRISGNFMSIYKEPIAYFVHQNYPKAKNRFNLLYVRTSRHEYIYRRNGNEVFISKDGSALGIFNQECLVQPGNGSTLAELIPQSDNRTLHIDRNRRTLAILYTPQRASGQVVPRAFEFIDIEEQDDRIWIEALTFLYLMEQNLSK